MEIAPIQFYSAMGAIIAALIAGFLSLLSLVTSKDQKISELRHQWIADFRKELSELNAEVSYSMFWVEEFHKDPANRDKNPYFERTFKSAYLSISNSYTSLSLRIDSKGPTRNLRTLNQEFLTTLTDLREKYPTLTSEQARSLTTELREKAAPILRAEWEHIKKGEMGHRILKLAAGLILVLGLVGAVVGAVKLAHIASPSLAEPRIGSQIPSQVAPQSNLEAH